MEIKSKWKANTHAHRQHRSDFIHGVAVSACTDVGVLFPWMVKAQLSSHIPDEGAHPGRASANTHKLKAEDTASLELFKLTGNTGVTANFRASFRARPLPRVSKEVSNQLPGKDFSNHCSARAPRAQWGQLYTGPGCLWKAWAGTTLGLTHQVGGSLGCWKGVWV